MPHTRKKRESNTDRLSKGKAIARAKALSKSQRASECTFDPVARADFLTGFHKRKLARQAKAQSKLKEEERASKISMRADLRAQRKAELAHRLAAYQVELGLDSDDQQEQTETAEEEWHGFTDGDSAQVTKKKQGLWSVNEYEDDEKLVSVVVEEM